MWRIRGQKKKGKERRGSGLALERCSSNSTLSPSQEVTSPHESADDRFSTLPFRHRSHTYAGGESLAEKRSKSVTSLSQTKGPDDMFPGVDPLTFSSPRHFFRRRALGQSELQEDIGSSIVRRPTKQGSLDDPEYVMITVEGDMTRMKDRSPTREAQSLRDILEFMFIKNNVFLDLAQYHVSATRAGSPVPVDLDTPSTQYAACAVDVRPLSWVKEVADSNETFHSVSDCLAYFSSHGLEELPNTQSDEDSYRLPRVTPIDPIECSWEDLPIDTHAKNSLSSKECDQQRAIWELIYTEHSLLRQLEVVINVFMRCLELIRRANVLSEDGYHNVFGYMEEIYDAHVKFWSWTLQPCLEKVYETRCPLKLSDIVERFPSKFHIDFEIYEQHCALESLNLQALNDAMINHDFNTYIKWCEGRPECHRLKLKDFLAMPMQRLMKYPLLIAAISKDTTNVAEKQQLECIWSDIQAFVQSVNHVLWAQQETERVRDAMNRITTYSAVEMPSDLRELIQPHTHLDLLAPMPGLEVDKPRVLMLEGNLKFRDPTTAKMVVHVFLFTDLLLLTKAARGKNFTVVRPPCKITSLVIHPLEPGSFFVLVLNEFRVVTTWFVLRANSAEVAEGWMEKISAAQQFYKEAVDHKAHNWELIQNLRGERILNGIEHLDALNVSNSLSQSLLSLNSVSARRNGLKNLTASNESLLFNFSSGPPDKSPLTRTLSGETRARMYSSHGQLDLSATLPVWMERTSSLNTLREMPECGVSSVVADSNSTSPREKEVRTFPRFRSKSIDTATQTEMCQSSIADLFKVRHSPISDDDSSTDSDIPNEGVSLSSTSPSESQTTLERENERNGTPIKRNSTGSTSNTKSPCPSGEQKIRSILRTSSPRFDSNTTIRRDTANLLSTPTPTLSNGIISPTSVVTPHPHTVLPTGAGSPSSEDGDVNTNSPSPKVEVVQCHTTEALAEMRTGKSVQTQSGDVQFHVTYVNSRPEKEETTKPQDEEQEGRCVDDNESESSARLEESRVAFPPNCEPQSEQPNKLAPEQPASVADKGTKSSETESVLKQNMPTPEKPPRSHKVMFSSDTKSSSPDPKRKNRSVGSLSSSYSSAATASSVNGSTSKPKQNAPKQSGRPDPRRHSLPAFDHSTRVEMQKSRLFGTKVHITPAHRRVTGKSVRELSQLYEATSCSSKPTHSGATIGTRSVSSKVPHSVSSTKAARGPTAGAQATTSKLRAETSDGSIPSQANLSSKRRDAEKRRAPVHSRSFSQPAQSLSKPMRGAESSHRKQRTKSEILRIPLQGILKRRPNGAVNATSSGTCTSTQTECENFNSNNNFPHKYSLSLPSRHKKSSRGPIVRFSEGQDSSCLHQTPKMYDKKMPAEWENFALSWSYSDHASHKLTSPQDHGGGDSGQSYVTQVTVVVPPQH